MLTTIGSPKEDMITLYNNFQYPDGELRNCQEFITLNPQSSDFSRYRPVSGQPFDGFLNGHDGATRDKDYRVDLHASNIKQEASDTGLALFHKMKLMNSGVELEGFNGSAALSRQNSSPPTFFSNLSGFPGSSKASTSNINFSLGSMYMPQMPKSDDNPDRAKRQFSSSFQPQWDDDQRSYSLLDSSYPMNTTRVSGLTHQLSLPAPMDKALQFGGSVSCKIRAKRGCATHPRSIAERVRRTRISERMRKLQDLFPDMDKNTSTADMLEMAVEHIKDLQTQVKTMTEVRARCTCKRMHKKCPV